MPLHLLLPLLASLLFVVGAMFARHATSRGINPYTVTALSNMTLALCWLALGVFGPQGFATEFWLPATAVAVAFVTGQLCTYLALQLGDVSLVTPIFGIKIVLVAIISSLVVDEPISIRIWIAAFLAALGVAAIQSERNRPSESRSARQIAAAVALAAGAAFSLSLFDVSVQIYGRKAGPERFLSTMFVISGAISSALLLRARNTTPLRHSPGRWPLLAALVVMAMQAICITYALGRFGDATRANVIYSLRGLWSVALAWILSRSAFSPESTHSDRTLLRRLLGAVLLTAAVCVAVMEST